MSITNVHIEQFRNIREANIVFDETKTNVLVGDNRSGKTSVLEAINFLLNQKSFKTNKLKELVSYNEERCRVEGSFSGVKELVLKSKILLTKDGHESVFTSSDEEQQTLNR